MQGLPNKGTHSIMTKSMANRVAPYDVEGEEATPSGKDGFLVFIAVGPAAGQTVSFRAYTTPKRGEFQGEWVNSGGR